MLENNVRRLVSMIKKDAYRMDILKAIKTIDTEDLWIAGGFVRNLVWDKLHNYKYRTELGDVDVFYLDKHVLNKLEEDKVRNKLSLLLPNVIWSVKNQARMHFHDNNEPYQSLYDALAKFPETASAVAVQIGKSNKIDIISPFGLDDLFSLKVTPTPSCRKNELTYERYLARQKEKQWTRIWPLLTVDK
jgi:hypothetical protein